MIAALALVSASAIAIADAGDAPPKRACQLEARVRGRQTRDGVMIETALRNRSSARIEVTVDIPCPGGAVQLVGLPAEYDADSTCTRAGCVEARTRRVIVPSGAERVIDTTTIHTRGDSCNEPLPAGVYMITAQPRFQQVTAETCATPYRMVVSKVSEMPSEPPPTPPKKGAPRAQPRPSAPPGN